MHTFSQALPDMHSREASLLFTLIARPVWKVMKGISIQSQSSRELHGL